MSTRLSRLLVAVLAVATVVPGLVLVTATPATAVTIPVATSVETRVTPSTPMWVVDFVFTFNGPIDCSGGSLDLHYRIAKRDPVTGFPSGGTTGMTSACTNEGLPANQAIVHFDLLGAGADAFPPSEYVDVLDAFGVVTATVLNRSEVWVKAKLYPAGRAQDTLASGNPLGYPLSPNLLPTAPVWIGAGDGYSSQLAQTPDGCITTPDCYNPNDLNSSWIGQAAESINIARVQANNADGRWSLQAVVIAKDGATSASVATGQQNTQMRTELGRRIIPRAGNAYGSLTSWNWISVSAGLVDVGIPAVMQAYAAGANGLPTGGRFPYNVPTNPAPWAVANGGQCPDLGNLAGTTGVLGAINGTTGSAIIPNLNKMVGDATTIDPSVHIVQVLYPWLTEPSNPCASDQGTVVSNRTVMQRLRLKTDITGNPNDNIVALDLQDTTKGFGDTPTGVAPLRADSRLWLSRPYGYPYPSRSGIAAMTKAATVVVGSAAADVLPPEVFGTPLQPPATTSGAQWWNLPSVDIQWTADDPSGLDARSTAEWKPDGIISQATEEGLILYQSPTDACDVNRRCAVGRLTLAIDHTKPVNVVTPDRDPDHGDWYNKSGGPVTLTWTADDTKYDADGNPVIGSNGQPVVTSGVREDTVPAPVVVDVSSASPQAFGGQPAQVCDRATNCDWLAGTSVKVDLVDPTLGLQATSTDTTPLSGWYQQPVTVNWTKSDAHSGLDTDETTVETGTLSRGTQTYVAHVCDNAGNCVDQAFVAQVDGEAPTVSIVGGGVGGDTYPAGGEPTVTCVAEDQPDLSGVDPSNCVLTVTKSAPDSTGKSTWTYTANAKDVAGNSAAPTTLTFYVQGTTPTPTGDGRMTGEGEFKSSTYGTVDFDLSLRCSGTASSMNLEWGTSSFELDGVSTVTCKDDGTVAGPGPFDTLALTGTGTYCKGGSFGETSYHDDSDHNGGWWNRRRSSGYRSSGYSAATYGGETSHHGGCTSYPGQTLTCVTGSISMTLVDAGSGKYDSVKIVIKDNTGKVVLAVTTPVKLYDGNLVTSDADTQPPVDRIAPTVTPKLTSSVSPSNGWYRSNVTVSWTTADTGGSGLVTTTPPASTTVSANGETVVQTPPVCDKAGNCSVGTVTVKLDKTPPTVEIAGASNGGSYTQRPDVTCTAADQVLLSGLAGSCTLTFTSSSVSGGTSYTYTATAKDNAGNTTTKTITFKVVAPPTSTGRMTGGGTIRSTNVNTSFTLRCNGSPNNLDVFFDRNGNGYRSSTYGNDDDSDQLRFTLLNVTSVACSDDPAFNPGSPSAPIDTFSGTGTGKLSDGRSATISWTFTDHGEPGVRDTAVIVIKAGSTTVLSVSGTLNGGNFQALYAQGNGTNNNGNVNGPNGHSDYDGAGWHWTDSYGDHTVDYDNDGCHYQVETSSRIRYEDDDRQGNRTKSESKKKSSYRR